MSSTSLPRRRCHRRSHIQFHHNLRGHRHRLPHRLRSSFRRRRRHRHRRPPCRLRCRRRSPLTRHRHRLCESLTETYSTFFTALGFIRDLLHWKGHNYGSNFSNFRLVGFLDKSLPQW